MGARRSRSGWVPAAVVLAVAVFVWTAFDVGALEIVRYLLWLAYGVALPGTLVWRALRGTPRSFVEDACGGLTLGFAMEILVFIAARAIDVPQLVLAWPAIVAGAFAVVPALRRPLRGGRASRVPASWSWSVAVMIGVAFLWLAMAFFRTHPLEGEVAAYPYVDMPYHLALAGEVKHHMPPTWPYVLGEPLHHHWFSHAEMAATSWATGLELRTILLRLQVVPFLAIGIALTATLGSRAVRRWWAGPVAVLLCYFVGALSPFGWGPLALFDDQRLIGAFQWQSPSSVVAGPLLVAVALLVVDRLRGEPGGPGQWTLIAILLAAGVGTKSTVMPLFLAGAGLVALRDVVRGRRWSVPTYLGGAIAVLAFANSTVLLYGGGSYGLRVDPFEYLRRLPIVGSLELVPWLAPPLAPGVVATISVFAFLSWLARGAGMLGFAARPRANAAAEPDRAAVFLAGMVIAGFAAVVLFTHPGSSQVYFLRSAFPFLGVLGAWGFARLLPAGARERRALAAAGAAAVLGGLGAWLASRALTGPPTTTLTGSVEASVDAALEPMLVIVALIVQVAVALALARRRVATLRGVTTALVVAFIAGTGLFSTVREAGATIEEFVDRGTTPVRTASLAEPDPIPDGALVAARWLRDHSDPGDVVATNVHCRVVIHGRCDNRHFWVSAYTERRILVEGWGYTAYALAGGKDGTEGFWHVQFWDPERLEANDRAFRYPSAWSLAILEASYGVRWLFAVESDVRLSPNLPAHARLRFRSGSCVVYELGT